MVTLLDIAECPVVLISGVSTTNLIVKVDSRVTR